jgi:hypothetical protein
MASMRLRLILSFVFIGLVSIVSVILLARRGVANEVYTFMFRGGMTGSEALVETLEAYYRDNNSWQGVESILLSPGHGMGRLGGNQGNAGMMQGMMGQRLRLVDEHGKVLVDTLEPEPSSSLDAEQMERAILFAMVRMLSVIYFQKGEWDSIKRTRPFTSIA